MSDTAEFHAGAMEEAADAAEAAGRLFGVVHDGDWFHVGTAEGLAAADSSFGHGHGR
mgnify:CR=1 FL=1